MFRHASWFETVSRVFKSCTSKYLQANADGDEPIVKGGR
jgi:hypothetical protein